MCRLRAAVPVCRARARVCVTTRHTHTNAPSFEHTCICRSFSGQRRRGEEEGGREKIRRGGGLSVGAAQTREEGGRRKEWRLLDVAREGRSLRWEGRGRRGRGVAPWQLGDGCVDIRRSWCKVLSYAISGDVGRSARAFRDDLRYRERGARAFSLSWRRAAGDRAPARAVLRANGERRDREEIQSIADGLGGRPLVR